MVPFGSSDGYEAARRAAALLDRSDRGLVVLSGPDRAAYLHGLLTNDVASLQPGQGCYAAYLTPQGRMITDLWVYALGDLMLVAVGLDVKDALLKKLDQLVFAEDVQVADATSAFGRFGLVGPEAGRTVAGLLQGVTQGQLASLPEHGNLQAHYAGQKALVLGTTDVGEAGFDVLVDTTASREFADALAARGIVAIGEDAALALRVEAGIPKFHQDMDETTIPLEVGLESRAISFTKGCYVGQEVIVRVLHRGHGKIARKLVGITFDSGEAPERSAVIRHDGHDVGVITSGVVSPALKRPIALGYVHRELAEPGSVVDISGRSAMVTALPFVPR